MTAIRQYLSCQDFVEQVTTYLEGELRGPLRDHYEEHYVVCPACRFYQEQMRITAHLLLRLGTQHRDDGEGGDPPAPAPQQAPERGYERAFKFLAAGRIGPLSRVPWPPPGNGGPGAWISSREQVRCVAGVHACRAADLPFWLDDELWTVELDGVVERASRKLVARRGRLVGRIEDWTPETAAEFADSCVLSLWHLVPEAIRETGLVDDAGPDPDLHAAGRQAEQARRLLRDGRVPPSDFGLLQYFCDAVAYRELPQAAGFIAELGHNSVGGPAAADAERRRQAQWLVDRLRLPGAP